MLRSRGEHPVRLEASAGHQVVNEDANVRFIPPKHEWRLSSNAPYGVDSGGESLGCRLFVARRPVDLPRQEKPRNSVCFERGR